MLEQNSDEGGFIPLSALQHFVYCPRQCALIHLERLWADNRLTAEGNVLHAAANIPQSRYSKKIRRVMALPLSSQTLCLTGVADLVEFRSSEGADVPYPVEYKRGKPKMHRADEVQLCAQAMCLEEMTGMSVPEGALYYAETKRRTPVPFDTVLRGETLLAISGLREMFASLKTPRAEYKAAKCRSCSLFDLCRPRSKPNVHNWIKAEIDEILAAGVGDEEAP